MAGIEEKVADVGIIPDGTEGLIIRSIKYMWETMTDRQEQYFVKAAFMEVYNEQLRDLLNPSSGVLHCRWNVRNVQFTYIHIIIGIFC